MGFNYGNTALLISFNWLFFHNWIYIPRFFLFYKSSSFSLNPNNTVTPSTAQFFNSESYFNFFPPHSKSLFFFPRTNLILFTADPFPLFANSGSASIPWGSLLRKANTKPVINFSHRLTSILIIIEDLIYEHYNRAVLPLSVIWKSALYFIANHLKNYFFLWQEELIIPLIYFFK